MDESLVVRGTGLRLPKSFFEPNENYEISFDYVVLEGSVMFIGGHFAMSDETKVYVDGELIESNWHIPHKGAFPQSKGLHNVRIVLNTNLYDNPYESYLDIPTTDRNFYIQPNRYQFAQTYKMELSNFKMINI